MALVIVGVQFAFAAHAKGVVLQAAREAARTMAIYHDYNLARQKAVEIVSEQLNTDIVGPGGAYPYRSFDPDNANPVDPDVVIIDDGNFCSVKVNYHVKNIMPGFPRLYDSSASPWDVWITVKGAAVFKREAV